MDNIEVRSVGHTALTSDQLVYRFVRERLDQASELWKERAG